MVLMVQLSLASIFLEIILVHRLRFHQGLVLEIDFPRGILLHQCLCTQNVVVAQGDAGAVTISSVVAVAHKATRQVVYAAVAVV